MEMEPDGTEMKSGFGYMMTITILIVLGAALFVYKDGIQAQLSATTHIVELRSGAMAKHTVIDARVGDEITLRVSQKAQLYIIERVGIEDPIDLSPDRNDNISWIVRHPGTVKIGCSMMPAFEIAVNVTDD